MNKTAIIGTYKQDTKKDGWLKQAAGSIHPKAELFPGTCIVPFREYDRSCKTRALVNAPKERQPMINRLAVFLISISVLGSISCGDDSCSCTSMACKDGVSVTVESETAENFPEGEYILKWESGDISSDVGTDGWGVNHDPTKQVFYIPRHSGEYTLTENAETITLELYLDGESVSERADFDLIWETTTCNYCSGPCQDLVTNAEIEMVVAVP
jgi:hypothetical protein